MSPVPELKCPHCRKTFLPSVLGPGTARAGYKCPHCRLFMPAARAAEPPATHEAA